MYGFHYFCFGNSIYYWSCRIDRALFSYLLYRVEDAIEILEYILKVREEKLGTANPDVDDEKKRLAELLKEAGRSRIRKGKSLKNLLGSTRDKTNKKDGVNKWSGFNFGT